MSAKLDLSQDEKVPNPPNDTVSSLNWSPTSDHFVTSSWDGEVRVYHVNQNLKASGVISYKHEAPVLISRFSLDGTKIVSGGGDKKIILYNLSTQQKTIIGTHNEAVSGLDWVNETILASTSWDKKIKYWNIVNNQLIGELELPNKIYCMSIAFPLLAAAMKDKIVVVNLNQPQVIFKTMEIKEVTGTISSIKSFSGENPGFVVGTSSGKGSYVYIDETKKIVSIRCHTIGSGYSSLPTCFPINQVLVHPFKFNVFFSLTSNKGISFYNATQKNKLGFFPSKYCITAGEFDRSGRLLAYATGYDWNKGYKYHTKNEDYQIFLHDCKDIDSYLR